MIKRVEVNYRGIFQKNLGKKIGSDIVMIASRMGQTAFSNGRYSDSPEETGFRANISLLFRPDLAEEELEAECGAKLEIDDANISVVLDDTMCKGVEPWGWHGVAAHQREGGQGRLSARGLQQKAGRAAQVHRQETLQLPAGDPRRGRQSRGSLGQQG